MKKPDHSSSLAELGDEGAVEAVLVGGGVVRGMCLLPGGGVRLIESPSTGGTACGFDGATEGGAGGRAARGSAEVEDGGPGVPAPLGLEGEAGSGSELGGVAPLAVPGSPLVSGVVAGE